MRSRQVLVIIGAITSIAFLSTCRNKQPIKLEYSTRHCFINYGETSYDTTMEVCFVPQVMDSNRTSSDSQRRKYIFFLINNRPDDLGLLRKGKGIYANTINIKLIQNNKILYNGGIEPIIKLQEYFRTGKVITISDYQPVKLQSQILIWVVIAKSNAYLLNLCSITFDNKMKIVFQKIQSDYNLTNIFPDYSYTDNVLVYKYGIVKGDNLLLDFSMLNYDTIFSANFVTDNYIEVSHNKGKDVIDFSGKQIYELENYDLTTQTSTNEYSDSIAYCYGTSTSRINESAAVYTASNRYFFYVFQEKNNTLTREKYFFCSFPMYRIDKNKCIKVNVFSHHFFDCPPKFRPYHYNFDLTLNLNKNLKPISVERSRNCY